MAESKHFIHEIIDEELKEGGRCYGKKVHTRFPPEPNGYLHIGHAKALEIDFGTAELYGGLCNLRMDDTNPTKEDEEYVEAIKEDIKWLGHDWEDRFFYASEYFEKMYEFAVELIKKGLAYVCELTPNEADNLSYHSGNTGLQWLGGTDFCEPAAKSHRRRTRAGTLRHRYFGRRCGAA